MQRSSGYIERTERGCYEGAMDVEGVDLSPIEGVYFQEDGNSMLWLRRKPVLEYIASEMMYKPRPSEPRWEAYLKKNNDGGGIAYKGVFTFLHFRYSIVAIWDKALADKNRMNFFAERLPMEQQNIINSINERFKKQ